MTTGHNTGDVAIADTAMVRMTSKKFLSIHLQIIATIAERCGREESYACLKEEANEQKKY